MPAAISHLAGRFGVPLRLALSAIFLVTACSVDTRILDADGDGYTVLDGDCWDRPVLVVVTNGVEVSIPGQEIGPGMVDDWYDGIDANCDGADDFDADGDGFVPQAYEGAVTPQVEGSGALPSGDCWDDPSATPDDFQALSGLPSLAAGVVYPGAEDIPYDGIDADCGGPDANLDGAEDDFDADGDGYASSYVSNREGALGEDCIDCEPGETLGCATDDNPAALQPDQVNPGVGAGYDPEEDGPCQEGWDCDACYDGTDADCGGEDSDADGSLDEEDCDRDGYEVGVDCDDEDSNQIPDPSQPEIPFDGLDNNCDLTDGDGDSDLDGFWDWDYQQLVEENPDALGPPMEIPPGLEGDCWDNLDTPASASTPLNGMPALTADAVFPGAEETYYDGIDQDCMGEDTNGDGVEDDLDWDGDGFASSVSLGRDALPGTDCNDCVDPSCGEDPSCPEFTICGGEADNPASLEAAIINPDALETWYDGTDQDCAGEDSNADGVVDDWDADQDGFASADELAGGQDCDDSTPQVSPGVNEDCSTTIDDDCDEDTNDEDADGCATWYEDADGDGYGDPSSARCTCEAADTHTLATGGDCDDATVSSYPGATEICDGADNACVGALDGDEIDDDGDGFVECTLDVAVADWSGSAISGGDDCLDSASSIYPGATEICDGADNDCDGSVPTEEGDGDADGWVECALDVDLADWMGSTIDGGEDCDDADGGISPGTQETCDGVDDDCDGDTDEAGADGSSTWYLDADLDGYGDPDSTTLACDQPSGYVADNTDCDDTDASIYPSADEYCDAVDNDCDLSVDESGAVDASTWYVDTDGDGYGDATNTDVACSAPSGYVANDDDCNDASNSANPGGTEVCDSLDNNCDGTVDEDTAADASTWYDDSDSDGYGDAGSPNVACNQPSGTVSDDTDCDDTDSTVYPGADEYCDTVDDDCDGDVDESDAVDAATWYEDQDTDGYGDASSTSIACDQPSDFVADSTDCDDSDGATFPGADEYCDAMDNNCDGTVDEDTAVDASTWYPDDDGDGYGDSGSTDVACNQPSGFVSDSDDCDDSDAAIYPAANELCDSVDNDCDGQVDDDDPGLSGALNTFYADMDLDGYGDATTSASYCAEPSGYVSDDTDCDDGDADINPGATEIPQDGIDQDCDGTDGPFVVADLAVDDLIITEIMQNPSVVSDSFGEWFEVYNNSGGPVDLEGLYVYDTGTESFTVSGSLLVDDGEYLVFCLDSSSSNGGVTCDYDYAIFNLGNADDEIYLAESSSKATVFDNVDYDNGLTFPDPSGYSMALDPDYLDATDNDDGANWCEATTVFGSGDYGTPGSANDSCTVPASSALGDGYGATGTYGTHGANYLLAQPLTLSADITLTGLAIEIYSGSTNVQLALYTDSSSTPDTLVAYTNQTAVSTGSNELSLAGGDVSVSAGTYWVMELLDATSYVTESSTSGAVSTWYQAYTAGSSLPSSAGTGATYNDERFALWLLGY